MVYATLTERPPPPGSDLHMTLQLLGVRHNAVGVICGTYGDSTMGTERIRPLPTLSPVSRRVIQVDVRNTTWSQGRNRMLQAALELFPDFEYIAMSDDDGLVSLRCCHARPHVDCTRVITEIMMNNQTAPLGDMRAQQLFFIAFLVRTH
jgi:hypothetical protein